MMNASAAQRLQKFYCCLHKQTMIFLNKSSLLQSSSSLLLRLQFCSAILLTSSVLNNVNDKSSFAFTFNIYSMYPVFNRLQKSSNISLKIDHENCPNMLFKAAPSAAFRHLIYPVNPYDTSAFKRKVQEWWCKILF